MANPFDVFDAAPARGGAPAPAAAGNPFDRFDEPAGGSSVPTPDGAMRVRVGGPTPEPTMGIGEAAWRGAGQGLTLNFGDELSGLAEASGVPEAVRKVVPPAMGMPIAAGIGGARMLAETVAPSVFGQDATGRYQDTVQRERMDNETAMREHPVATIGGELAGGLAGAVATPMLAPFRAAQGAGLVARGASAAGNLAATGAAYGGVAGAGTGEGGIAERLRPIATGAAIGGVAGPVLGGALHGTAGAGRFVADNARAVTSPGTLADRLVGRALRRDNADLPALADDLARAREQGQPLVLADIAGSNTQGVAGDVARLPGEGKTPAREFLRDRQVGSETTSSQGERIADRVSAILGDRGAIETADQIIARRQATSKPAYEAAHAAQLDYAKPAGQKLLSLLERVPNQAKAAANQILKVSDQEGSQMIWRPDEALGFVLEGVPNTRQLDYIKRGLDSMIEANTDAVTGRVNTLGHAVAGLKREILGQLDRLNPAYAAARKLYAGDSELLDALRKGQSAMLPKTTGEALRKEFASMSPGEQDMYRLGAASAIRDRLANAGDGNDKVRLAYGTPAIREKINAMVPDDAARKAFSEHLRNEGAMFATRNSAVGNSATAERLAGAADTDSLIAGAGKAMIQAGTGHLTAAIRTAFDTMRQVNPELRGRVMNEARKVLFDPNPANLQSFIKRLESAEMKEGTRQRVLSAVSSSLPRSLVATGQ